MTKSKSHVNKQMIMPLVFLIFNLFTEDQGLGNEANCRPSVSFFFFGEYAYSHIKFIAICSQNIKEQKHR